MSKQKEQFSVSRIPRILKYCCEAIVHLGGIFFSVKVTNMLGTHVTGIFRISGGAGNIDEIKASINRGIYPTPTDVHAVASVLKLWLRSMPQPLIPVNF